MDIRARAQRSAFNRRVMRMYRFGDADEQQHARLLMADPGLADSVYLATIEIYVDGRPDAVVATADDGTPILDKLIDFIKWLWESGALLEIIKLIIGGMDAGEAAQCTWED